MEGPGKKPSTEFTRLHEKFEPGAFGYGKGEYLHAKGRRGQDALFPNALPSSPNGNEAVTVATKARRKGAKLVKKAMLADHSETVVEAALRRVHNKTGRLFDENNKLLGVTRGDLNLLRKELNREPTKFKQLYERHGPDLFGIGGGQHLHAERVREGQVRLLYARAPLTENSSEEMTRARKESVKLVKRAMELEYGDRAKAVFRNVREKVLRTGRDLKKDLTRGDLELLHKGLKKKQPATFIEIFSNFGSVLDQRPDEPVRGEGTKVYIHDSRMSHGSGEEAAVRRQAKCKAGAELVRQTIINQVGEARAKATLAAVEEKNPDRSLGTVVTLNDLKLISRELLAQRARYQNLKNDLLTNAAEEDKKGITKLYDAITRAVPGDRSPKSVFKVFERLKGMVHDGAKAQFECVIQRPDDEGRWGFVLKIGDTEIYRADRLQNGPGQHHIELEFERANASEATDKARADLAEVWLSARKKEDNKLVTIQWPNGDATSAVELWSQLKADYLDRNNMQFDVAAGKLTLEVEGAALDRRLAGVTAIAARDRITTEFQEGKMRALADFIRGRFGVGPEDRPAFQNIANNILSYVQQGMASTLTDKMLAPAVLKVFVDHNDLRLRSTFSVTADRNVGVDIDIRLPYRNIADRDPEEVIGSIDYSKYVAVRRLHFEISRDHLHSETFDPKDDLRAVSQVDAVEITD